MDPIIGALAALVISMFGVVGFTQFAKMGVSNIQTAATASQQQAFDAATQQYVQDNAATLAQSATAAVPVTITAAQLATAGYLPAGYLGTNSFGQTWQAQVLQPTAGQLETLVTSTGGNSITDTKQLAQIAAETGAAGGFVPYANQAGTAFNTNAAYGTYGSWTVPLTAFSNPGSGHLASLLQFTNVQANTAYLYRVPVVNHPELNNMQTDLGLTSPGSTRLLPRRSRSTGRASFRPIRVARLSWVETMQRREPERRTSTFTRAVRACRTITPASSTTRTITWRLWRPTDRPRFRSRARFRRAT
jgi:hypothetical protein